MRTAVVTGGGSGIGLAVAERLRKDGLRVATIDLKPSETDLAFAADVTDRARVLTIRTEQRESDPPHPLGPLSTDRPDDSEKEHRIREQVDPAGPRCRPRAQRGQGERDE